MSAVALTVATVAVGAVGAYTSYKTGQRANDLAEENMIRQQGVEAAKLQTQREELRKMEKQKDIYRKMEFTNPYAQNIYEDMTVNQQAADFQKEMFQQQQANVMQGLQGAAGGSGIAALAQQMANQGQLAAQKAAATIGDQEAANQKAAAEEAANIQRQKIEGAEKARTLQYDKTSNLMNLAAGEAAAAGAAKDAARQEFSSGIGQIASSAIGLGS